MDVQDNPALSQLSPTERLVLIEIAQGATNQSIAKKLCRSLHTIKSHRYKIGKKLGPLTRVQLARLVLGAPSEAPSPTLGRDPEAFDAASILSRAARPICIVDVHARVHVATTAFWSRLGHHAHGGLPSFWLKAAVAEALCMCRQGHAPHFPDGVVQMASWLAAPHTDLLMIEFRVE